MPNCPQNSDRGLHKAIGYIGYNIKEFVMSPRGRPSLSYPLDYLIFGAISLRAFNADSLQGKFILFFVAVVNSALARVSWPIAL